eukprot:gene24373-9983_t
MAPSKQFNQLKALHPLDMQSLVGVGPKAFNSASTDQHEEVATASDSSAVTSEKDCKRDWGSYNASSGTCMVVEYLAELCVKLQEDPDLGPGFYQLDTSQGAAGCHLESKYNPELWKRVKLPVDSLADELASKKALTLPKGNYAASATHVVIMHHQDPELREKQLRHELRKEKEPLVMMFAIGLGLLCVSMVSLLSIAILTLPTLTFLWKPKQGESGNKH